MKDYYAIHKECCQPEKVTADDLLLWIDDYQDEVADAVAYNAVQTLPDLANTVNDIESYCAGDDYKWSSEAPLLSEIIELIPEVKKECEIDSQLTFKYNSDPAPAA